MKTIFKLSVFMVILSFCLAGCKSKKDDDGLPGGSTAKLTPPSWIQGIWTEDEDGKVEIFKFTSNDVFITGVSLSTLYPNVSTGIYSWSLKETKNSSTVYEITATASAGGETAKAIMSFKKGDGTYIEAGSTDDGSAVVEYDTFYKKK